jgi:hypothetical protein
VATWLVMPVPFLERPPLHLQDRFAHHLCSGWGSSILGGGSAWWHFLVPPPHCGFHSEPEPPCQPLSSPGFRWDTSRHPGDLQCLDACSCSKSLKTERVSGCLLQ